MSIELKDTLNLPKTEFPMRGDLVKKEPARVNNWKKISLYQSIIDKNKKNKPFILHDGPPFTNGDLHLGHALNKTLKDTILRYKWMKGFNAPYIPGWDSHGLPIEYKVTKELQKSTDSNYDSLKIRSECAKFAKSYKNIQTKQFIRLGVLADWENEYWTIHPEYEAEELRTFSKFIKKGLVYRNKKPVYWSVACKTALAEAEIEYKKHKSISVYVKFKLTQASKKFLNIKNDVSFLIWTTTPWTLPANLAIAINPKFSYSLISTDKGDFIIATDLINPTKEACSFETFNLIKDFPGSDLEKAVSIHPFINRESPVVFADYINTESGTGCVHTAPGHGLDDYLTGLKYNLDIYSPINDAGHYVEDQDMPKTLVGLSVAENNNDISEANKAILRICSDNKSLIAKKIIEHSYPHCWRSKTPVIFRAMDQWFIELDKENLREKTIDELKSINFIPEWGEKRINAALQNRPDWCISRQRSWGVPIPAFYDNEGTAYICPYVTEKIADKVEKDGCDIWFKSSAQEILSGIKCPQEWPPIDQLIKGNDTLDVWIDSGCSHRAVLSKRPNLKYPADLYLEGSDQHRGWFQSSLWTSVIASNHPPFKNLLTHGFIVKEDGTKLSKSDGASRPLEDWINKYGADIIRLWICSQDYKGDVPVSDKIVNNITNNYRTIRNTLRFLIGNLHDFDINRDIVDLKNLHPLDKWALNKLSNLVNEVTKAYDSYEFHRAFKEHIDPFCTNTLSSTYHAILKDRLYTRSPNDRLRRSSQNALYIIFNNLIKIIAPILPFTSDEAYAYFQSNKEFADKSIALENWPNEDENWKFPKETSDIDMLLDFLNSKLNEKLEKLRQNKIIGQSLDAQAIISGPADSNIIRLLKDYENDLCELFILSKITIQETDNKNIQIKVIHADGEKCPRSWRWVPELVNSKNWGKVSPRCKKVLDEQF